MTPSRNSSCLVFDVDGVLLDTSGSFQLVVETAIQFFARRFMNLTTDIKAFTDEHYRAAKENPLFNDDYDIAWTFLSAVAHARGVTLGARAPGLAAWRAMLKSCDVDPADWVPARFGERVDRASVRMICEELYYGRDVYRSVRSVTPRFVSVPGLWRMERPFITHHWSDLPLPVGIYTGRSDPEMELALKLLDWTDIPRDRCITTGSGVRKPSPRGLELLAKKLGKRNVIFFGDTESDRTAFKGFGKGRFIPIGPVFGYGERYATLEAALQYLGLANPGDITTGKQL